VRLTSHLHVPNVMEIWEPKPPGTLWATPGLLRDSFLLHTKGTNADLQSNKLTHSSPTHGNYIIRLSRNTITLYLTFLNQRTPD